MITNNDVAPHPAAPPAAETGPPSRRAARRGLGEVSAPEVLPPPSGPVPTGAISGLHGGYHGAPSVPEDAGSRSGWRAVYTIVERGHGRRHWLRVGIAFVNRDQSLNVRLDALPVSGQLHIREAFPREREGGATGNGELPPLDPGTGWRDGS